MTTETNALWKVWDDREPIKIPHTEYTLRGFSIAALRTNFYIKELSVMLDGGLSANLSPEHIFITHSHSDHIANLPFHLYSVKPDSQIQIYAPQESCTRVNDYLQSILMINADCPDSDTTDPTRDPKDSCYKLNPVSPSTFDLTIRKKKFKIEVIKCYHGIPCVGYGFIELRSKLKDEYVKLQSSEIGALRRQGIEVSHEVEFPIFCFLGDTSKDVLNDPAIEKYKNIMIECTFIKDEDMEQADKTFHMHWKYLEPYVRSHPDNTFILYHFSRRYKKTEVEDFFKTIDLVNIIPWIN